MPRETRPAPPGARATGRYTMSRLEQVRVLAHPLRLRLLEAFAIAPRTTRQVAELLGVPPTRLYHHVNALERVGLVRLRETRPVRGTVEKYFEAVGRRIEVDSHLFDPRRAGVGKAAAARAGAEGALAQVLDLAGQDLTRAFEVADRTPASLRPMAMRMTLCSTPAHLAAVRRRILRWAKEWQTPVRSRAARGRRAAVQRRATLTVVFACEDTPFADAGPRPARRRRRVG